ncbi:MAG: CHAT domain-containing protein [Anaerolineae bacterium]
MGQRAYIDFKLYLTPAPDEQGACQVALLPTPEVGETVVPVTAPIEERPPGNLLALLASKQITLRDLITVGKKLANCLIPEGVIRERFRYAYDRAGLEGGVRLRIIIADHGLKQWPWEYTYLNLTEGPDDMAGFLAHNARVSLVRHEPLPHPHPVLEKGAADVKDLRLAIAAALPVGERDLDLDKEVADIKEAVHGFDVEGVRITPAPVLMDATPEDITKLPQDTYIFHFLGHGVVGERRDRTQRGGFTRPDGALLLVKDKVSKEQARLRATDLAAILQQRGVRLALLGACHTGHRDARYPWDDVAGAMTAAEIPTVIAMQYEVKDAEAIAFSRAFYTALALGQSLDEAVWSGRVGMLLETSTEMDEVVNVEWGVPVLYSRLRDGALFPERIERATAAAEQFRKVVVQTVDGIHAGTMTGVQVGLIENGVKIVQKVKEVRGHITGIKAGEAGAGANILVEQEFETVGPDGVVCGGTFDVL